MRKRKYLIGPLVGLVGALAFSGIASATPVSHSLQANTTPAKQDPNVFGGASLRLQIRSQYDSFATSQSPRQLVVTIDRNMKLVNGNLPACLLSQLQGQVNAAVRSACARSIVGQGTVTVNGGVLTGQVLLVSGGPKTLYAHVDVANGAVILALTGTISGRTLTITGIPNTPGTILDSTDVMINKVKTGKRTFYLMARCRGKSWTVNESTSWYSGETLNGSATQKCAKKGGK